MGNTKGGRRLRTPVMATAEHPTVDADGDPDEDVGHQPGDDQPDVAVAHATVVPTNFKRD